MVLFVGAKGEECRVEVEEVRAEGERVVEEAEEKIIDSLYKKLRKDRKRAKNYLKVCNEKRLEANK